MRKPVLYDAGLLLLISFQWTFKDYAAQINAFTMSP
jgi:hypothetical protein